MKSRRFAINFALIFVLAACIPFSRADDPWPHRQQILKLTESEISRIFGNDLGDFNSAVAPIREQLLNALGGPPDAEQEFDGDRIFFSACRAQSCNEKAAEIVDLKQGRVYATALQHYHCRTANTPASSPERKLYRCDQKPALVIFIFQPSDRLLDETDVKQLIERLQAWGQSNGITGSDIVYKISPR